MDENECKEEINEDGINIIYTNFVNIDYNGIMYFTQTEKGFEIFQKYTHFFYIHDTAEFLENFMDIINASIPDCTSCKRAVNGFSQSTGLINTQWFITNRKKVFSYLINYDHSLKDHLKHGKSLDKLESEEFKTLTKSLNIRNDNYNEDYFFEFIDNNHIGPYFADNIEETKISKKYSSNNRMSIYNYKLGIVKHTISYLYGM